MAFEDTKNKAAIRRQWDRLLLETFHASLARPLTYLGLCGPEVRDLRDWRDLLGRRTAVESRGATRAQRAEADETIGRLNNNILRLGLSSGFELLLGDIETVLTDGVDDYGTRPQLSVGKLAHDARYEYDLVNLDFDGGLGYRSRQGPGKRITALKDLFRRQQGHDFTLFLTINVRDKLGDEIRNYLSGLKGRTESPTWQEAVDWYLARGPGEREYCLKAVVPSFIQAEAESRLFKVAPHPPIFYEGHERARMLHFAFTLRTEGRALRAFSDQGDAELLGLPLLVCEDGVISAADKQAPGTALARLESSELWLGHQRIAKK